VENNMAGFNDQVRVLLVEDDEDDYLITADILSLSHRVKFQVEWQSQPRRAFETIQANRHDVYLIDYRLGQEDGLDLIGQARQAGCDGPFILLTGLDDWDIDVRAMEAGAADYIVKGKFDSKLLERSIRYTIEQQRSRRELMRYAADIDRKNHDLRHALDLSREATELKHQFLANISHEIRTPMTGVIGMNQLLLETELTEEQRDFAETAAQSAQALMGIIDDLLDASQMEAGNVSLNATAFSLADVVDEVMESSKAWLRGRRLQHGAVFGEGVRGVYWGDAKRIRQVLLNLVNNAMKFTEHGSVEVRAAMEMETSEAVWMRCEVRDTGTGVPPQAKHRIFQPFYQADGSTTRRHGGAGLGLAICQQLVELLGGHIGFDSGAEGSTFWFTVPLQRRAHLLPEGLGEANFPQLSCLPQ
jgi:signal transduction histidine kinase